MNRVISLVLLSFGTFLAFGAGEHSAGTSVPQTRRPIALALSPDGNRLFVANRAGSITLIDPAAHRVIAEFTIGRRLADLITTSDGQLLAVDEAAGELIVMSSQGDDLHVRRRVSVPAFPVCVRSTPDGQHQFVASLWSRQVTLQDAEKQRTVDVPFSPRLLLPMADAKKLLVADSFGGRLAVIDTASAKVESLHSIDGHAIRGLAARGNAILLAHRVLSPRTPTTAEEMHWGNVVRQEVRSLSLSQLLTPGADVLQGSDSQALGEPGRGAGDPAGLAVAADGTIVVALGGVGEIAFGKQKELIWQRLAVGRRPSAVVLTADGRQAIVADTFGDAIAFVNLASRKVEASVSLGTQPKLTAEERGEQFFYDARLSREGWMSCNSCHIDGHTNGGLSDTLSDGGFGAPKRTPSLLGVKDTGPWTWIGGSHDLAGQIKKSIQTTMRSLRARDEQVSDIAAYLQTLQPPPPIRNVDKSSVSRGREVFDRQGCVRCHAPPTYTTPKTYNVGLHDEAGNLSFNPPSLRGVGQAGPYLHDGRAATLQEVFTSHGHPGPVPIPPGQVDDLANFLRSL